MPVAVGETYRTSVSVGSSKGVGVSSGQLVWVAVAMKVGVASGVSEATPLASASHGKPRKKQSELLSKVRMLSKDLSRKSSEMMAGFTGTKRIGSQWMYSASRLDSTVASALYPPGVMAHCPQRNSSRKIASPLINQTGRLRRDFGSGSASSEPGGIGDSAIIYFNVT